MRALVVCWMILLVGWPLTAQELSEKDKLAIPDAEVDDYLGWFSAAHGDLAVLGKVSWNHRVFVSVLRRSGLSWFEEARIQPPGDSSSR